MKPLRIGVVADLLEERWPSMDLVADMLMSELSTLRCEPPLQVELLRPSPACRFGSVGRYLNRYVSYATWLRTRRDDFDVFHIVDHSYAHLVHVLPAERTVVTCHDVDAFMPLVDPSVIPTRLPNAITRLVLSGMQKAASVACDTIATRDEVLKYGFVGADRLAVVPVGVHPALKDNEHSRGDIALAELLGPRQPDILELLHVGSCIPRKRIDVLLRAFAAVREAGLQARLLKAGGKLTAEQNALARQLGIDAHITQLPFLEPVTLAALYRRADVALVTSEREGFGLPVVEALSAGTPVVASDIPVLREVGGLAATYASVGDISTWRDALLAQLRDARCDTARLQMRRIGLEQSGRYTWAAFARSMAAIYLQVANVEAHAVA